MAAPVSIHPATIIEMMLMNKVNAMKRKSTEATYLSFCFSAPRLYMFIPVHVASPVKENKGPREEGRTKKRRVKKKEERHAVK